MKKLVKEDNKGVTKEEFYSNQNTIENGLNKNYEIFSKTN